MKRKTLLLWIKRIGKGTGLFLLVLVLSGSIYEYVSRISAESNYPPPGDFADVGGHRLHYLKLGSPSSTLPTVVFESGLDQGGHLPWSRVQTELANLTTTVSYDRAGVLWSERGDNPKSGVAIAKELHALLEAIDAPKPYILVGHSLAGLTLRSLVAAYPDDIAGIVFVDVSHPDQAIVIPELRGGAVPPTWVFSILSSTGFGRLFAQRVYPATEPSDPINVIVNALFPSKWTGLIDELLATESLLDEARTVQSFGDIPLTIITGAAPTRWDSAPDRIPKQRLSRSMMELQESLLELSSNSVWIHANESGHYVQLQQPALIIEAIREQLYRQ